MVNNPANVANNDYVIEMLNITKEFPGIIANDNITLQLRRGEIHALLGENGAGKSTLMSVLFGLYRPEKGEIRKNGEVVTINNPNDATALNIGMVHQHFKLVEVFTVLDNIILGDEPMTKGILVDRKLARQKIIELSNTYNLNVDPDAKIEDISVGMQQRVEILKMLYRNNDILIFDEPTAVLTPQEIDELMEIMRGFAREGKSILFITHKLNEIMAVADRCSVLRKGKYMGTVDIADTDAHSLSKMMVGRDIDLTTAKGEYNPGELLLKVEGLNVINHITKKHLVNNVSFNVRAGEVVCLAGIEGNGQGECIKAITGLVKPNSGDIKFKHCGNADAKGSHVDDDGFVYQDFVKRSIRYKNEHGMSHIPEDRHRYGLVLDYSLANNMALQSYFKAPFQKFGFLQNDNITEHADKLIEQYDVRSGQGAITVARSMSGGNQQKAIIAREISKEHELLIAVQPTRGLDVGAIEYIHKQIIAERDNGKGILLVSLELDEVMNLADRILVMFEGKIVAELDPKSTTVQELGLYMAGSKQGGKHE